MADVKETVILDADASAARKEVDKTVGYIQKSLDSINFKTTITSIQSGFALAETAFNSIRGAFNKTFGAAIEFESLVSDLNKSLKLSGNFTDDAAQSYIDLANAISETTGIQDELILKSAAVAQRFNLTNKETERAIRAAVELSAATGEDLNSSIEKVARTFNGFVDRDLAKTFTGLKLLTKEQLIAGGAADLLSDRLRGSAEAAGKTTAGEFEKLGNTIADAFRDAAAGAVPSINFIVKGLNDLIAKNKEASEAVKAGRLNFQQNQNPIPVGAGDVRASEARDAAAAQAKALQAQADAAKKAERELLLFREQNEDKIKTLKIESAVAGLTETQKIDKKLADDKILLNKAVAAGLVKDQAEANKIIDALSEEAANKRLQAERTVQKQIAEFEKNGKTGLEKFDIDASQKRLDLAAFLKQQQITNAKEVAEYEAALNKQIALDRTEELKKSNQAFADDFAKALTEAALAGKEVTDQQKAASVVGAVGQSLRGQAGATNVVSSVAGAAADAALPGSGGIAKEIVGELAKGPEEVKKTVTSFVQAIPTIITNILTALPQLVFTLIKEIPKALITFIKDGIPELIKSFAESIPQVITQLVIEAPKIAVALIQGIIEGIPKIIVGFVEGLIKGAQDFVNALIDAIGQPFQAVGDFFSGIGDFLGLAQGGRVPDSPRYMNDQFPARLDAGEQVFSRDLTGRLENFLNSQSQGGGNQGPQNVTVNLKIGERELANVLLDLNRRGFRTA